MNNDILNKLIERGENSNFIDDPQTIADWAADTETFLHIEKKLTSDSERLLPTPILLIKTLFRSVSIVIIKAISTKLLVSPYTAKRWKTW